MYENGMSITIMLAFLLTVVAIFAYEAYWEHREEKAKAKHAARLAKKAVEIYGNHIPEELEEYIKAVKDNAYDA